MHGRLCDRLEKNHGATMDPGMELLRDGHKASRVMTSRKTEIGLVYLDFSDFLMDLL